MEEIVRLDSETLATTVNGKFVFAYDWTIANYYDVSDIRLAEPMYTFTDNKTKVDLMDIIKTDFLLYQDEKDWDKLLVELEKDYKNNLTD